MLFGLPHSHGVTEIDVNKHFQLSALGAQMITALLLGWKRQSNYRFQYHIKLH